MIVYYLSFEGLAGRTPGKFACGTCVVDLQGGPPRFGQVVGRTFARLIPFDAFALLLSEDALPKAWHDSLANTRVVMAPGRG
jgi:uncharacterized RDD family membrane protein YckC